MTTEKQPFPNHNWCVGCSPENCSGCGTASQFHPLHDEAWRKMLDMQHPGGYAAQKGRRTGLSMAIALKTIAEAIRHPYKPILIRDHFGTTPANRYLATTIHDIIVRLGLREMYVSNNGPTLTFGNIKE